MADLGATKIHKTKPRAGRKSYVIANGVTLYAGALVGLEGGYLNHWADGTNDRLVGIVLGEGDGISPAAAMLGDTSASVPPEARCDESGVTLEGIAVGGTPTQADVGGPVYCADSDIANITKSSTGRTHPIGRLTRFRSVSDCDVELFTPAEMLAQQIP